MHTLQYNWAWIRAKKRTHYINPEPSHSFRILATTKPIALLCDCDWSVLNWLIDVKHGDWPWRRRRSRRSPCWSPRWGPSGGSPWCRRMFYTVRQQGNKMEQGAPRSVGHVATIASPNTSRAGIIPPCFIFLSTTTSTRVERIPLTAARSHLYCCSTYIHTHTHYTHIYTHTHTHIHTHTPTHHNKPVFSPPPGT